MNKEASNSDKSKSGKNTKYALNQLLKRTIAPFPNIKLEENVTYGEPGKDPKQFKIKHQLIFTNPTLYWLIDETSSFKSDRVKGKQFVMEHTKKILHANGINSEAYLVVPDNCNPDTIKNLALFNKHIKNQDQVNYFDGAMTMSKFSHIIEKKATESILQGKKSNIQGDYGEKILAQAFNNANNVRLWNDPSDYLTKSTNYSLFKAVINKLAPQIGKLKYSKAYRGIKTKTDDTDSISEQLRIVRNIEGKTFGKPKTDVLIELENEQESNIKFRISVKHPDHKKGKVTIHEGSIERLISDLRTSLPSNSAFNDESKFKLLEQGLLDFQAAGSQKKMSIENRSFLNAHLSDLNKWLIDYFIFGINNSLLNDNQKADALLIFNPDTGQCQIKTIQETEDELLDGKMAAFGTPFSWTYPSKKRGKKIQIKGPFKFTL